MPTDSEDKTHRLVADDRTPGQVAVDTFVSLLDTVARIDTTKLLPVRPGGVHLLVTETDYMTRTGYGRIEGQTETGSIGTVERRACESGILPILFDGTGQPLNLGRTQRLFTLAQRNAIAARDGGCRAPDCDRPPAMCEVHHTDEWFRHRGPTDVVKGILLCVHHHLWVHNLGWRIIHDHGDYYFIPPRTRDPEQTPIPARPGNPLITRLTRLAHTRSASV